MDSLAQKRPQLAIVGISIYALESFSKADEVIRKKAGTNNQQNFDQRTTAQLNARSNKNITQSKTEKDIGQNR